MNPLTNIRNVNQMNQRELELGIAGGKTSWHMDYKDSAWIFVGGLPYDLTEGDVICVFSQYGEIVNINLVRDQKTGKSKGFCFICFEDQRSTILTVDNLNGIKILGRTLRVDHVKDYKPPKDTGDEDEITARVRAEGVAPRAPPTQPEEQEEEDLPPTNKHKKEKKKKKDKKKKKSKRKSSDSESESSASGSESYRRKRPEIKQEKIEPVRVKQEKTDREARDSGRENTGSERYRRDIQIKKERDSPRSDRDRERDRDRRRDREGQRDRDRYGESSRYSRDDRREKYDDRWRSESRR